VIAIQISERIKQLFQIALLHQPFDLPSRIMRTATAVILEMIFIIDVILIAKVVIQFNFKILFHRKNPWFQSQKSACTRFIEKRTGPAIRTSREVMPTPNFDNFPKGASSGFTTPGF
jgi:hypothetical protein